jgi:hypothetical protein
VYRRANQQQSLLEDDAQQEDELVYRSRLVMRGVQQHVGFFGVNITSSTGINGEAMLCDGGARKLKPPHI